MFAASFDSKMGCLYSVFDVKKQGKPIREVRTRNWKLRGGENRLSGLLEGVSHVEDAWLHGKKKEWEMMSWDLDMCEKRCYGILACVRNDDMGSWHVWKMMSWDLGISLARGKQGSKGDQVKPLFKYSFCDYGSVNKQWGGYALFGERVRLL
ncbi:hypothetical protein GQ457_08G019040 [Hibiscus cannabinus]